MRNIARRTAGRCLKLRLAFRGLLALAAVFLLADPSGACGMREVSAPGIFSGTLCLPETPERVVTLDPFYSLLMAMELDLPVVGTALSGGTFPAQVADHRGDLPTVVGEMASVDLEAILKLQPDLIIGDAYSQAGMAAQLRAIAPTVLIETGDWKDYMRGVALAGGVSGAAEEKLTAYDAAVAATAAALPPDATVSFLRIVPGGFQVYVDGPEAYAPMRVLAELGLSRPPFETMSDATVLKRPTGEGLLELRGDVLIYTIGGAHHDGDAAALEAEVTGSAIWRQLPAVRAGRAFKVDPAHWMGFGGLDSAYAIIADVRTIFGLPQ